VPRRSRRPRRRSLLREAWDDRCGLALALFAIALAVAALALGAWALWAMLTGPVD